jgi:hypothetical protein
VTREAIEIAYAAYTATCTFLLDEAGICRRVVMASTKRPNESKPLARCVGAQYVASLDARISGGLLELPRVGASMLFARADDRGRIALVRTGVVSKFESRGAARRKPTQDPFAQTDGVRTSAPELPPTPPDSSRAARPEFVGSPTFDPLDVDDEDKTQRMQAVRRSDPALEGGAAPAPTAGAPEMARTIADEDAIEIDVDDLATAEYPSAPPASGPFGKHDERQAPPASLVPAALPTLRRPARPSAPSADELAAEAPRPRPSGRRRSEGSLRVVSAARSAQAAVLTSAPELVPEAPRSDLKLSPRRRR